MMQPANSKPRTNRRAAAKKQKPPVFTYVEVCDILKEVDKGFAMAAGNRYMHQGAADAIDAAVKALHQANHQKQQGKK